MVNTTLYNFMVVEFKFSDGHKASYALLNREAYVPKFIAESIMEISNCEAMFFNDTATIENIRESFISKNEFFHGKRQGYRRSVYANFQINGGVNMQYDISLEPFKYFVW